MNDGSRVGYFSLDSADHFDIVTLRVDSGLFHGITVQDCGYADC